MNDARLRLWTRTAPQALVAAVVVGWVVSLLLSTGTDTLTGRLGGDFPAFYGAGSIVADGDIDQLYDFDRQRAEQAGLFDSGFLAFAYPSYVAVAYSPLTLLPFRLAYVVHTIAALGAIAGAVWLARGFSATARRYPWLVLAAAVLSYPLFRAFLGGQNTAFGLIVIAGSWLLLDRRRDLAAGLVISVLAYKPQFLIPIAGVLLLARRGRATAGAGLGVGAHYLIGAAVSGWRWPIEWWNEAVRFANLDQAVNGPRSISWRGWDDLFRLEGPTAGTPLLGTFAEWAWVALACLTVLWIAIVAIRRGPGDPMGVLAMTLPAMLLMAPHAMFYDAGLTLPALLLLADRSRVKTAWALWAAGWAHPVEAELAGLGISPLVAVSLLTGIAVQRSLLR